MMTVECIGDHRTLHQHWQISPVVDDSACMPLNEIWVLRLPSAFIGNLCLNNYIAYQCFWKWQNGIAWSIVQDLKVNVLVGSVPHPTGPSRLPHPVVQSIHSLAHPAWVYIPEEGPDSILTPSAHHRHPVFRVVTAQPNFENHHLHRVPIYRLPIADSNHGYHFYHDAWFDWWYVLLRLKGL